MSDMLLSEVLRGHAGTAAGCRCGWEAIPDGDDRANHLADVVLGWLRDRATDREVVLPQGCWGEYGCPAACPGGRPVTPRKRPRTTTIAHDPATGRIVVTRHYHVDAPWMRVLVAVGATGRAVASVAVRAVKGAQIAKTACSDCWPWFARGGHDDGLGDGTDR